MTETTSRLRRLARPAPAPAPRPAGTEAAERCDLCGEPVEPAHRHLVDVQRQRLLCACRPCSILFVSDAAGGGHFRLVPDEVRLLEGFDLDDELWARLGVPVELAFFFRSTAAGRVVAFYPGPMGATESQLRLDDWDELLRRNPILRELRDDVEALLVNRARQAHEHWLVPVDRAYALVGILRSTWHGLAGGTEVWEAVDAFFAQLRRDARTIPHTREEVT